VFRQSTDGTIHKDIVTLQTDAQPGEPLLTQVMAGGRRLEPAAPLSDARQRAATSVASLPEPLRRLEPETPYLVEISSSLVELAQSCDPMSTS
jgi:nicotinate phosphoribosyltransferase